MLAVHIYDKYCIQLSAYYRCADKFDRLAREVLGKATNDIQFPNDGLVYDFCIDPTVGVLVPWGEKNQDRVKTLSSNYTIIPEVSIITYVGNCFLDKISEGVLGQLMDKCYLHKHLIFHLFHIVRVFMIIGACQNTVLLISLNLNENLASSLPLTKIDTHVLMTQMCLSTCPHNEYFQRCVFKTCGSQFLLNWQIW